jgi:hypothetical protein
MLIAVEQVRQAIGRDVDFEVWLARNGDPVEVSYDTLAAIMGQDAAERALPPVDMAFLRCLLARRLSEATGVLTALTAAALRAWPFRLRGPTVAYKRDDNLDLIRLIISLTCEEREPLQEGEIVRKLTELLRATTESVHGAIGFYGCVDPSLPKSTDVLPFRQMDSYSSDTAMSYAVVEAMVKDWFRSAKHDLRNGLQEVPPLPCPIDEMSRDICVVVMDRGVTGNQRWTRVRLDGLPYEATKVTLLENDTGKSWAWTLPQPALRAVKAAALRTMAVDPARIYLPRLAEALGLKPYKARVEVSACDGSCRPDYSDDYDDSPGFGAVTRCTCGTTFSEVERYPKFSSEVIRSLSPVGGRWTTDGSGTVLEAEGQRHVSPLAGDWGQIACLLLHRAASWAAESDPVLVLSRDVAVA